MMRVMEHTKKVMTKELIIKRVKRVLAEQVWNTLKLVTGPLTWQFLQDIDPS